MLQKEKNTSRLEVYKDCTVYINTENITQTINFGITPQEKHKLIEIGYNFTNDFFKNF